MWAHVVAKSTVGSEYSFEMAMDYLDAWAMIRVVNEWDGEARDTE